jgi:hypothetical protein
VCATTPGTSATVEVVDASGNRTSTNVG